MINQEIHFQKQHRSRLHSLHSYFKHTHNVIKAEFENVIIQLNQEMADKYGERFSTELASAVQDRPAAACVEETWSFDKEFISDMFIVYKQKIKKLPHVTLACLWVWDDVFTFFMCQRNLNDAR